MYYNHYNNSYHSHHNDDFCNRNKAEDTITQK